MKKAGMLVVPMVSVLAAASSSAEEHGFEIAILEACLAEAERPETCIGAAAGACSAVFGGQAGVGVCFGEELAFWDARLGAARGDLQAALATGSIQIALSSNGIEADLASADEAFDTYRVATCETEAALWPGMANGPIWAECQMQVTAHHALRMERWLERLE